MEDVKVAATAFSLPTGDAVIDRAVLVAAEPGKGLPERCQLTGRIRPAVAADLPIRFQINLPTAWNGKALQYGGGGSNGVVITGLASLKAPANAPVPLMRGYATFGSDSGHTLEDDWRTNRQALANFGGESVKRTRDAAIAYLREYYGRGPVRLYFFGGSKGGQEGLMAAQRYGADYDGVISYYPARLPFAMQMSWARMNAAVRAPEAMLSPGQRKLVMSRVMETCDDLDGARDGIISNIKGCRATFEPQNLRCPEGRASGNACLSQPQLAGLAVAASPHAFDFPLDGRLAQFGPYPTLEGADLDEILYSDRTDVMGLYYQTAAAAIGPNVSRDKTMTWERFDYRKFRTVIEENSALLDASSPDLDAFRKRGGKLLLLQGATDMLVPEDLTTTYWTSLRQRYASQLDGFARYYIQPGYGHGRGNFDLRLDTLTLLERWVERGEAPGAITAIDANPGHNLRTRPLCEYPNWPRYRGTGDLDAAANFECVAS
jgi:feruloyl esterase